MTTSTSMVQLDGAHPALSETIGRICRGENIVPISAIRDFDGDEYLIHVNAELDPEVAKKRAKEKFDETRTTAPEGKMHLSFRHVVKKDILDKFKTLASTLDLHFSPLKEACRFLDKPADPTSIVTLEVDVGSPKTDAVIQKAAQLRTLCLQAPLCHVFDCFLKNPTNVPSIRIPYRAKETLYVFGFKGQSVLIIASIQVPNPEDRLFIRSALQSFQDVRKHNRATAAAPGFEFSQGKAPADLPSDLSLLEPADSSEYFWVTFALSKAHLDKRSRQEAACQQIVNFRNYVHYHVNCMRSVLHQKMRQRVTTSLQVLNRAKTSATGKSRVQIK